MRALLPVIAVFFLACGGNVILDDSTGGTGGVPGAGGGAPGTGGGGATGVGGAGATGPGGAGGGSCTALVDDMEAALAAARNCDPSGPPGECTSLGVDLCGCPVILNSTGNLAADEVAAYDAMQAAGCSPAIPCPSGCPAMDAMFGQCLPIGMGSYQCSQGPG